MKRRDFLARLISGAAALPAIAAQSAEPVRRIGVLMGLAEHDPEAELRINALRDGLAALGWIEGHTVRIDIRWVPGGVAHLNDAAADLVRQDPDVLVGVALTPARALRHATQIIPIVFAQVVDPVGAGLVHSLAHPGGNATGFTTFEFSLGGKWFDLLREVVPDMRRALAILDSSSPSGAREYEALQTAATVAGIQPTLAAVSQIADIEHAFASFAAEPGRGAVVVLTGPLLVAHRDVLAGLALRYRIPAIYPYRYNVVSGGLMSYGADTVDPLRHGVASYIDRILRGQKPADLPVQAATKLQLVINLKTAQMLGLTIPATILARADEVIE